MDFVKIKSGKMLSIHVGVLREDLHVRQSVHLDNLQKNHKLIKLKSALKVGREEEEAEGEKGKEKDVQQQLQQRLN